MRQQKDKSSSAPDPFENYGPDVAAYFRLIKMLIVAFTILSLMILPVLIMNLNGEGYNFDFSIKEKLFLLTNMGNLGHATATCQH